MISICPKCGSTEPEKKVTEDGKFIICHKCNNKWPFKRMPLFIITGASGVGKTTTCQELMQNEKDYIVMDGDILFFMKHDTEKALKFKRETLLRMAKNIAQIGMPVVLNSASMPEQFEDTCERQYFSHIYYIAMVCESDILEKRMRRGRGIEDEEWIKSSISFNNWFYEKGKTHTPIIDLCDTTNRTVKEAAQFVDSWVKEKLLKK
jgi:adenylylsulfate kinase-like enzyme